MFGLSVTGLVDSANLKTNAGAKAGDVLLLTKPLGYRDPKEVDYDGEYDAMVARVKKLAGLGPMKTVYDPARRQYRNMPTAQQPKK
jgi:hypothetical protein